MESITVASFKTYLVMTVGTGTAGRHSNLAQGLVNTIDMLSPDNYYLIPSESTDSIAVAQLVREERPDSFTPWRKDQDYLCIPVPDSLESSRTHVRTVLRKVAGSQKKGKAKARLLVNPTSGTKQMSAGATLAALDLREGELVYTVGERSDGVVITGTEKIATFDASRWHAEQALQDARELYNAGNYGAAMKLLESYKIKHPDLIKPYFMLSQIAYAWAFRNFDQAASLAKRLKLASFAAGYKNLSDLGNKPSKAVVAESLHNADHFAQRRIYELAMIGFYRAIEMGVHYRIIELTGVTKPITVNKLQSVLGKKCIFSSRGGTTKTQPGLRMLTEQLSKLDRKNFGNCKAINKLGYNRNTIIHQFSMVDVDKINEMAAQTKKYLAPLKLQPPVGIPDWDRFEVHQSSMTDES